MSLTRRPRACTPRLHAMAGPPARRPIPRPRRSLGGARPVRVPTASGRRAHFSVLSVPSVVKAFSVFFLRASLASLHRSVILASCSRPAPNFPCAQLQHNLPLQLQLHEFPRSVDCEALMRHLSPFKINTSKNFCTFRIALTTSDLKPPIINTSMKNGLKSPAINTSKKQAGGWVRSGKMTPGSSPHVRQRRAGSGRQHEHVRRSGPL
jgi:hypothetical protein